ncbi:MAG: ABC transporter permease [Thermomicrobiales bacterium]|nr:ABC transporter permease [Thermomicrobiales bacterium]
MKEIPVPVSLLEAEAAETSPRRLRRESFTGLGLLTPAIVIVILFSLAPLAYLVLVSFTRESTFFFNNPVYTGGNYRTIVNRYMPHVWTTIRLATLASIVNLVFGFPFAYILARKISYRELVRTLMVFPLVGPLYLAFGLYYVLLPNGPGAPILEFLGINATSLLFSEPMTIFGMALFTFPFMVMNVVAALANVDPTLEEAASTLGAESWQTFTRVVFPLSWPGILAGFLMCFGWNLGVYVVPILLGSTPQQRVLSLTLQQKAMSQFDYGLAAAMGVVLMVLAFSVTWISLRFSRGALGA